MAKQPDERFHERLGERLQALRISEQFRAARIRWLQFFWRSEPFGDLREWSEVRRGWFARNPRPSGAGDQTFWECQRECGRLAEEYGLDPAAVEQALFLESYDPQSGMGLSGAFGIGA
ncbi:MAG: hypothetical protein AAB289_03175, partial [Chloroflexota bacterium]